MGLLKEIANFLRLYGVFYPGSLELLSGHPEKFGPRPMLQERWLFAQVPTWQSPTDPRGVFFQALELAFGALVHRLLLVVHR